VLKTVSSNTSPADGTFTDVVLTYTAQAGDSGALGITIGTTNAGAGRATDFDDVRLNYFYYTPVEQWRLLHFGSILDSGDALPDSNPDSDTLSNLLEFAFGTDPTVSNGSSISYGSGVTPGLPLPVLETITSNNVDFRAVFARRKEWEAAGLTYTVQFSADLSEWVDSSETPTLIESGSGDIDAVYVDYPLFIQTEAGFEKAQFFRLSISQD
jgi:hypothetical protein